MLGLTCRETQPLLRSRRPTQDSFFRSIADGGAGADGLDAYVCFIVYSLFGGALLFREMTFEGEPQLHLFHALETSHTNVIIAWLRMLQVLPNLDGPEKNVLSRYYGSNQDFGGRLLEAFAGSVFEETARRNDTVVMRAILHVVEPEYASVLMDCFTQGWLLGGHVHYISLAARREVLDGGVGRLYDLLECAPLATVDFLLGDLPSTVRSLHFMRFAMHNLDPLVAMHVHQKYGDDVLVEALSGMCPEAVFTLPSAVLAYVMPFLTEEVRALVRGFAQSRA
jgi:hypothetical protein